MSHLLSPLLPLFLTTSLGVLVAQTDLTCQAAAQPPLVRSEGITERVGDIVLNCTGGAPATHITGNLSLFLNVNITDRVASNGSGQVTGMILTVDTGSGPQPVNVPGVITGPGAMVFNGVSFTLSATGSATLQLSNVRAAANEVQVFPANMIRATLAYNSQTLLSVPVSQFTVADAEPGLYDGFSSKIICSQGGSPLPGNPGSFASFLASGAAFGTTRVTEGFADAFSPKSGFQGLNADTGTRFLVSYSGFPSGAKLFVPNVVAGSDALQPTAGGDFGLPASGGQYAPGPNGSLLLALVQGANASGAGGAPVYTPGPSGSAAVNFDAMSQVTLVNGAGIAVYEVVDASPNVQESAQFPTFLSLTPFSGASVQTSENVSFAPVSTVVTATATDPIPRFEAVTPQSDCTIVGDCNADYFPRLSVLESSLQYAATAGSNTQTNYLVVQNAAGGVLQWNATLTYQNGSGWLNVSPTSGENNGGIRVDAIPGSLAPGDYAATLTVDGGPLAGTRVVPITLTITPATPAAIVLPTVTSALNAATFTAGPLTPGSLATIMGSTFGSTGVTATFDGTPAQILFSNATQINILVPAALASKTSSQLVVSANGVSSTADTVALAAFAPGIFKNGILNEDYSLNGANHPAALGSVIQIFATGLSGSGVISATIGGEAVAQPYYAGPAPGLPGVQQIDLLLPLNLGGTNANVSVCGGATPAKMTCSPTIPVALAPASTN
jgi:uncharacterized protein (TIGR03437 family)